MTNFLFTVTEFLAKYFLKGQFCERETDCRMTRLKKSYELFVRFVTSDAMLNPSVSFPSICSMLHVSPASLNELLLREIGMDGYRIVAECRAMAVEEDGQDL